MIWLIEGLKISFGFLCVLALFHAFVVYWRWLEMRKLVSQGRVITWNNSLDSVLNGRGYLVHNLSSLPGKLWWIPTQIQEDDALLFDEVEEHGFVITSMSRAELKRALNDSRLIGKIVTLDCDPFDQGQDS